MEYQNKEEDQNDNAILTPKEIEVFTGFASTLKKIHIRLIMEGYTITEDGIVPPKDKDSIASKRKNKAS